MTAKTTKIKVLIALGIFLFPALAFFAWKNYSAEKNILFRNKKTYLIPAAEEKYFLKNKLVKKERDSEKNHSADIISRVSTDKKIIALTFDADMTYGMERDLKSGKVKSWYNEEVIKTLEETKTPATLFLTGLWIKNYPAITKQLAANPLFEIANHSYSHPGFASPCYKLPVIPDNLDESEIIQTEKMLKEYSPNYKKYFRFPGFCQDSFDIAEVEKLGYKIIAGDIKGLDGFTGNTNGIISRVVSRAKPGSIVILHMHGGPNAPETGKALPEIIRQLKERGYEFVKISGLIEKH